MTQPVRIAFIVLIAALAAGAVATHHANAELQSQAQAATR